MATHRKNNVLKPVPQHPLEPELDFKRGLWNRYFPGGHAMSMRSIDPGRRRGSMGEEQPQEPAIIPTYNHQLYNGICYSSTQRVIIHLVRNLLEPACDMLARGWPRAGTRN